MGISKISNIRYKLVVDYNQKLWALAAAAGLIRMMQGYVVDILPVFFISVLMYLRREATG